MMIFVGAFNGNGFKRPQNEALKTSHAYDTVDGRKPAPPNMYETLLIGIFTISTGAFLPSTVPGNEHSETKWPHLSQILNMANVSNSLKQPRLAFFKPCLFQMFGMQISHPSSVETPPFLLPPLNRVDFLPRDPSIQSRHPQTKEAKARQTKLLEEGDTSDFSKVQAHDGFHGNGIFNLHGCFQKWWVSLTTRGVFLLKMISTWGVLG